MIHAPFSPKDSETFLVILAQAALVISGFAVMFGVKQFSLRMVFVGLFLIVMATIVPGLLR